MKKRTFRFILLDEALEFIDSVPRAAGVKIYYNMHRVASGELDVELFKKLENTDIWEFRTLYNKTAYRLFAFWDTKEQALVIATHGIIKKTQKTPAREIAKAEQIRQDYFNKKRN